jgi:hypothetical protein
MTSLMFEVGAVWLVALLVGLPLFASMGLAAFAFVGVGGCSFGLAIFSAPQGLPIASSASPPP